MKKPKFVLIGAGSSSFTTAVLCGLLRAEALRCSTVALVDVDAETLDVVERLARKIVAQQGADLAIAASTDRRDVLENADYVTATISVGGDEAWAADLNVPARHGIVQPVGDSVGIGGMSRAFRHAPVLVEIAHDMEELCPDATLFNYSNPMTVNCRAVTRESAVRCVGLCIGAELLRRDISNIIGAAPADTYLWAAGVNHFVFAYEFKVAGRDAYPRIRERLRDGPEGNPFCADVCELAGFYPGPGDSHVAEFLPHFVAAPQAREHYGLRLFDIDWKRQRTAAFLEKFSRAADSPGAVDVDALVGTGGEEAQVIGILSAMANDTREVFFVNLPNRGQIANLPEDAVVEAPAVATSQGLKPLVFGELPEPIAGWTRRWLDWGELAIDAALSGSRQRALQCMAADPGCPGIPQARAILNELLDANGRWMRHFAEHRRASPKGEKGDPQ